MKYVKEQDFEQFLSLLTFEQFNIIYIHWENRILSIIAD